VPQPAHIHAGTCADLGDIVYPLEDVVDGVSQSTVDAPLTDLISAEHVINVHLSEDQMDVSVACAHLPVIGGGAADESGDEAAEGDGASEAQADENGDEGEDAQPVLPATGSIS